MTGHQSPHMTKASTRSAKTHVKAQQKGSPSMPESTTPLVRAHQLIVAAGAALEEAIEPAPTADSFADQVMAAARVLLDLRGKRTHLDAAWDVDVPRESWGDAPEVRGFVYAMDLPQHITARDEAQWWADLLGGTVVAEEPRPSGSVELEVAGTYAGVPVNMRFLVLRSEVAAAGLVSGEVAA